MREWNLGAESLLTLSVAADARLTTPNYFDDQIWELRLGGGEPPGLALETRYGLRALGMRIFPGFSIGSGVASNPDQFYAPPTLQQFFPNYLKVSFAPFPALEVFSEVWVPESNVLAGRYELHNREDQPIRVELRLYALFKPSPGGQPMGEWHFQGVTTLTGHSEGISPLLFMTGGARVDQAIYPSLVVQLDIPPDANKKVYWVHTGIDDRETSFDTARAVIERAWDAEITKLQLMNETLIDIDSGNPGWDAVMAISQKSILGSFLGPTQKLPNPSFVLARSPDRGFSFAGNGSDYDWRWDGQNAAYLYLQLDQLILSAPELAKGLLRNFLSVQRPDGVIQWKIGLAGQKSGGLSTPLLATIAWRIYECTEDLTFLEEVFRGLVEFLAVWFSETHDRDQDGHPEWDHTLQMNFDECPSFVRWREWGQGLDISYVETPDMASLLHRELTSLIRIAERLGHQAEIPDLKARRAQVSGALDRSWDDQQSRYHYIDRNTHYSPRGEVLGVEEGEFTLELDRAFETPARLVIRIRMEQTTRHAVNIAIYGRPDKGRGRVERLSRKEFRWFDSMATATTERAYVEIDRIEVVGLNEDEKAEIVVADFTRSDITHFLPLWAGVPTSEQANRFLREHLFQPDRYWREGGIPGCPADDPAYQDSVNGGPKRVSMLWNSYLVKGLVAYGYMEQAAELVTRLLNKAAQALSQEGGGREYYDPDEAEGYGERNSWLGTFPIGLLLEVLGAQLISPDKMILRGKNPFPNPITLRWRGVEIEFGRDKTRVMFPDGGEVEIDGEDKRLVEQISR